MLTVQHVAFQGGASTEPAGAAEQARVAAIVAEAEGESYWVLASRDGNRKAHYTGGWVVVRLGGRSWQRGRRLHGQRRAVGVGGEFRYGHPWNLPAGRQHAPPPCRPSVNECHRLARGCCCVNRLGRRAQASNCGAPNPAWQ